MSALDLDELERIAKAAQRTASAPVRYFVHPDDSKAVAWSPVIDGRDTCVPQSYADCFRRVDATHIGANSPDVTLALIARIRELEALLVASRSAGEGMRSLLAAANSQRDAAYAKIHAAEDELSRNGCDCDCGHSDEDHDDECDRCLACRIAHALGCPP